jgi:GNAT superfamily N-acetyltransferase
MSKSLTEAGLQFHDDVPNEEWLQHAIDYVKKQPKDGFGKPSMIEVTGTFNRPVVASISRLVKIPGARGEQSNVRENDLQAIMKIMRETGKLPLGRDGKEYIPLIGVDYTGQPWVLEGNHRIMAAWNLYTKENINKWDRMPVEIRYFDGGERVKDGPIYPGKMAALKEQYVTEDTLNEYRNALYDFVKSKFPTWPEYVLKDFLYAQAKGIRNEEELKDWLERNQKDFGQVKWRLEKLPITLDIFTPKTQRMIKQREGGSSNPYQVPRDAERHAQQLKMIQQQGVRTEPIIVAKLDNGYDLIEGWHRTIQHLQQYPEGYTGPAWVAYGATYTSEGVTEGSLEEVSQDTARSYAQKARASQKDLINQTHRKGADTDKLNKKIQNRQQGLNRAHTDKRYYKDDQGVAEDLAQGRNLNPETKKYVQDHKWKLTTVNPMDLDTDAFDDPYNRVIDIDVDHPVNFKDPIIVDANGVIIDGFHRAYQAQQQGLEKLPAYVPVKEVTEKVNPAILKHGYTKEKNYGDIRLVAQQQDLEEVFPSFVITAYDGDKKIAAVRFSVRDLRRYGFDKAKDAFLVSANTKVDPEYRKRGIAKAMYDFARELGNDIQPSEVQTDDGRKMWARWKEFERTVTESGSGYIPSKKEKNDPRFKTALSVDVKPDTLKKNAKAFGFKVSRAGIPPTLR